MLSLNTLIKDIPSIPQRFLPKLKRLGIKTVRDLLRHFPTRYEDWSEVSPIAELKAGDEKTIHGIVQEVNQTKTWKKRMIVTEALVADESGSIRAVWFNQPYIGKMLQKGKLINIAGKVVKQKNELLFSNPAYELVPKSGETKHTARIVPIYPETKGLTSKGLRFIIKPIIESLEPIPEFIPEEVLEKLGLPEIHEAVRSIHIPSSIEEAGRARERFAFQDLFLLQMKNAMEKEALKKQRAPQIGWSEKDIEKMTSSLPFTLTDSQRRALGEILSDIKEPHPMNRLLQGDVGSGKTVVAGIAALLAVKKGLQSAFMAPTEILARQHYRTLTSLFPEMEREIGLLVSKEARIFYESGLEEKTTKKKLVDAVANGKVGILVGTHALIQKGVEFQHLGFVVVDEQHRFGVRQRAKLTKSSGISPHFLSMSATPIPRTLMMSVFGNLDISLITELPKGRKKVITKIVDPKNRDKAYAFIRGEVRKGKQVYVVCPRIEQSTHDDGKEIRASASSWSDVKAVEDEYEKLSEKVFPDLRVAKLHGRMKSAEKEAVMKSFASGGSDILVSTTVIEVGVDVPNATIMMIEGAERFGLAQLYQLRGRVGRSELQSFCFLFTDSNSETAKRRLQSLLTAKNSFELAEKDLEIRGPGEFLGEAQSGMPDIAMTAIQNPELLKTAQEVSREILEKDPELNSYPRLKARLDRFDKEIHLE